MLGIVLGVASLVGMSALVKGMENGMREAMQAVGGIEKVSVIQQDLPPSQSHLADQVVGITMDDVEALKKNATLTKLITPEMHGPRRCGLARQKGLSSLEYQRHMAQRSGNERPHHRIRTDVQ